MAIAMRVAVIISMLLCLASASHAAQGTAVWYKPPYVPSKCFGNNDNGPMVAGVSAGLWNNGAACGQRYRVRCIGGANLAPHPCKEGTSVVVKVVDFCKQGCTGDINLSRDAFSVIADLNAGKVRVQYDKV